MEWVHASDWPTFSFLFERMTFSTFCDLARKHLDELTMPWHFFGSDFHNLYWSKISCWLRVSIFSTSWMSQDFAHNRFHSFQLFCLLFTSPLVNHGLLSRSVLFEKFNNIVCPSFPQSFAFSLRRSRQYYRHSLLSRGWLCSQSTTSSCLAAISTLTFWGFDDGAKLSLLESK